MRSVEEVIETVCAVIKSNEDPSKFQQISLRLSLKKEYLEIMNSISRDESTGRQIIDLMVAEVDNEPFIHMLSRQLKKVAIINLSVAIRLFDVDTSKEVFSTQSCDTLEHKVMDLQEKSMNEMFEVKFNLEGYDVLIYFHLQDSEFNMLFTSGYLNPEASGELFVKTITLGEETAQVGFIGTISGDSETKVRRCIEAAAKAVRRRVKEFIKGFKSVEHIDAMTTEEVLEKFFPDQTEEHLKKVPAERDNSNHRTLRLRRPKNELVDLTIGEEDASTKKQKSKDKDNESVCSEVFFATCCSDGTSLSGVSSRSIENEEVLKKLIRPPFDQDRMRIFMSKVDPNMIVNPDKHQVETRPLHVMEKEFAKITSEMYQRQDDEEYRLDKQRLEVDNKKETPITATRRPSRDDSKVTKRAGSRSKESSLVISHQPTILEHLDRDFQSSQGTSQSARNQNENLYGTSSNPPQLHRGITPKDGATIDLSSTKSKLFNQDEIEKVYGKTSIRSSMFPLRQSKLPFSSQQPVPKFSHPTPSNFNIPRKHTQSPDRAPRSNSVIEKSPSNSLHTIASRRPINSRSSDLLISQGHRGAALLDLARKRLDKPLVGGSPRSYDPREIARPLTGRNMPQSIEEFLNSEKKPDEIINLDENDEENENNNNNVKKRKLFEIAPPPPPTSNRIFLTKEPKRGSSRSKPNFSSFDGSSR